MLLITIVLEVTFHCSDDSRDGCEVSKSAGGNVTRSKGVVEEGKEIVVVYKITEILEGWIVMLEVRVEWGCIRGGRHFCEFSIFQWFCRD